MKTNKLASQGFTVVELIIAIIVGTVFIITINSAVNSYVHLARRDRSLILANSFVEGEVEALRNAGYNTLNTGTTNISSQLPSDLLSPKSASLQVTTPFSGVKQVDITVTYTDQVSRTYTYTTYMGELGIAQ